MAGPTGALITQCRTALGLTQQELGTLLGRTKRTIQRWEQTGAILLPSEVEALAGALYPVRPDLAEQLAVATGTTLDRLGVGPPPAASTKAMSDRIDAVVRAAAEAMGVAPAAIRPAVGAAFARACEEGLDAHAVVEGIGVPVGGTKA